LEFNMTPEEIAAQTAADEKTAADKAAADKVAADAAAAPAAETPKGKTTRARVLLDCDLGNADDVVNLSAADLKSAHDAGKVDPHPSAVKYAQSLKTAAEAAAAEKQAQDKANSGE
jgi:trimeric autotransporter adhesin